MKVPDTQKVFPSALPLSELPPSDSTNVHLDEATATEKYETWLLNYAAWGEGRPLSFYLAKEDHLCSQPLTRAGGITHWVLVDGKSVSSTVASIPSTESDNSELMRHNTQTRIRGLIYRERSL